MQPMSESMLLHWSPRSPFVRKVMVALYQTGLVDRVELVRTVVAVASPNSTLQLDNPLSKIPTLVLADGTALYDSRVICEYLDSLHAGPKLCPAEGQPRWQTLRQQALADGLLDLLLVWRQELGRPAQQQSQAHLGAYAVKVDCALNLLDREVAPLGDAVGDALNIAQISAGCTLSYADFRFPDLPWRAGRDQLARWAR